MEAAVAEDVELGAIVPSGTHMKAGVKRRTTDTDEVHALVTFGSTPLKEKIQIHKKTKGSTSPDEAIVSRELFADGDGADNQHRQEEEDSSKSR